ncbi:MAG TPA: TlpA disulfide reductase family protein [Sediminibacterium sp.]|nr:TlpA disulfide reductase family protein [Sediminibacterium sp.]
MKKLFSVFAALLFLSVGSFARQSLSLFGKWRGSFPLKSGGEIPFSFEIRGSSAANATLYFINAGESYPGGSVIQRGDSVYVSLDQFDNLLVLGIGPDQSLTGFLRKQNGKGAPIPVTASKKILTRFPTSGLKPVADISSGYDVVFTNDSGRQTRAVGIFKQKGNALSATFLRVTGDSRYSEGIIEGNQFSLSVFIGSSPTLFTGIVNADGSITGKQIGLRSKQSFTAIKNEQAKLPDAYSLTALKEKEARFNFAFKNAAGKLITLDDTRYQNKPVIVTIGGTWCPNCADEAAFLSDWYRKNKNRGIEVIAIQFEVLNDFTYAQQQMNRFKKRFNIPYEQVFGGLAENAKVQEALPALEKFISYPTTLFIDRNGKVNKIHTGFTGPATGKFYTEFIKEFNAEADLLLKN